MSTCFFDLFFGIFEHQKRRERTTSGHGGLDFCLVRVQ